MGTTTITASQPASNDGIYPLGMATTQLVVSLVTPKISNFTVASRNFGTESFTLTPPTSPSLGGAFTYTSSNPVVATITGNVVTIVNAGSTTITTTQAAAGNYTSGTIATTFVVNPIAPTFALFRMNSPLSDSNTPSRIRDSPSGGR